MKFSIQFAIGKAWCRGSIYTLQQFCVFLVDSYALTNKECTEIVTLPVGGTFIIQDLKIKRVK